MQARLSWPAARSLAAAGARVRRADWSDRYVFRTTGGLYWLGAYDDSYRRVVQGEDFQRSEFLAADWTDADPDQNHCVGIDFGNYTAGEMLPATLPEEKSEDFGFTYNSRYAHTPRLGIASRFMLAYPASAVWTNTTGFVQRLLISWAVGDATIAHMPVGSYSRSITLAPGGSADLEASMLSGLPRGDVFMQGVVSAAWTIPAIASPDTSNYGERVVDNPFVAACTVTLSGSVSDDLLVNGVVVRSGADFAPLTFVLASGGSFTIAARSERRDFPFWIGYDVAATFTV